MKLKRRGVLIDGAVPCFQSVGRRRGISSSTSASSTFAIAVVVAVVAIAEVVGVMAMTVIVGSTSFLLLPLVLVSCVVVVLQAINGGDEGLDSTSILM